MIKVREYDSLLHPLQRLAGLREKLLDNYKKSVIKERREMDKQKKSN
jgi:hypothetical protein